MKIGILIGRFLPLHNGHTFLINLSATKVEKLIIVISNDEKDWNKKFADKKLKYPSLRKRVKWLTQIYKDTKHITITSLKNSNNKIIKRYSPEWFEQLNNTIEINSSNEYIYFTNDNNASKKFIQFNKDIKVSILGKNIQNLSSENIRNNINEYWGSIPSQVRSFFTKKICFIGSESTGKTTLIKTMSKLFNTSWSEEYGRLYSENIGAFYDSSGMILFSPQDYNNILIGQYLQNEKAFNTSNKLTLIDTDAIYTKWFMENQYGEKSSKVNWNIVDSYISEQKKEYIYIFLEPNIPFINDGFRINDSKNGEVKDFYQKNGINFNFIVDGKTYEERFWQVYEFINLIIKPRNKNENKK